MRVVGMLGFLGAVLALFMGASAQALSLTERTRTSVDQFLVDLESSGVDSFYFASLGKQESVMTIKDWRAQMTDIAWYEFTSDSAWPGFAGERRSAFNLRQPPQVHLSRSLAEVSNDELALIGMHESLGALGYEDNDYQISGSLWLLKDMKQPDRQEWFQQTLAFLFRFRMTKPPILLALEGAGGSGTSVGKGGDLNAVLMKYRVLRKVLQERIVYRSSFLELAEIQFEPDYEASEVKYGFDQHLTLRVTIPVRIWAKLDSPSQTRMVGEIADEILSIYTMEPRQPALFYGDCSAGRSPVRLPRDFAPAAARLREEFLRAAEKKPGCTLHAAETAWIRRP